MIQDDLLKENEISAIWMLTGVTQMSIRVETNKASTFVTVWTLVITRS